MHQLCRSTGSEGKQLPKGVPPYTVWARCGETWPARPGEDMPPELTAWDSLVDCPECLARASWVEKGIPL